MDTLPRQSGVTPPAPPSHNRKSWTTTLAITATLVALYPAASFAGPDETALEALLLSTGGSASPLKDKGWGEGTLCSDVWEGVRCINNRVTELNLSNLGLEGELPKEISNLKELTSLELSNNHFTGELPDALGTLTKLKTLTLDQNAFEGSVPVNMKALVALKEDGGLDLRYNRLTSSNDAETDQFLDDHQEGDVSWTATQTITPSNFKVTSSSLDSISLTWDAIPYTGDGGYYEILVSPDADLSVTTDEIEKSDSKTSTSISISGLNASSEYHFAIRTRTKNPGGSRDPLVSDFSDSVSAFTLLDTDRDGTADVDDTDADNDGISNTKETLTLDSDGDGIKDYLEANNIDTDGDGDPNHLDSDDDNDGKSTLSELGSNPAYPSDADGDGIKDYLDADSNNTYATADRSGDSDHDGLSDKEECPDPSSCADTDGDGLANYMDADDDNDFQSTASEGSTLDSDGDGIIDALEPNKRDTDGDGKPDYRDSDDDGDGKLTRDEIAGNVWDAPDRDEDNIPDYLDADSNNIEDTSDGSGDSDKDGISDFKECPNAPDCPDANRNNIPSYMDPDEDTENTETDKVFVLGDSGTNDSGGGVMGLPMTSLLLGLLPVIRRRRR